MAENFFNTFFLAQSIKKMCFIDYAWDKIRFRIAVIKIKIYSLLLISCTKINLLCGRANLFF